jgi:hypothetical protein
VNTCAYKVPSFLARFLTQWQLIEALQLMKLLCLACAVPTMSRAGINGTGMCIGLPLCLIGQYLGELAYSLLGDAGVHYGIELGTVKPRRISGFAIEVGTLRRLARAMPSPFRDLYHQRSRASRFSGRTTTPFAQRPPNLHR